MQAAQATRMGSKSAGGNRRARDTTGQWSWSLVIKEAVKGASTSSSGPKQVPDAPPREERRAQHTGVQTLLRGCRHLGVFRIDN